MSNNPSGLRKGLTSYGDPGFSRSCAKPSQAKGFSDDALDRPIIGVTDTYSDFNPCHGNVRLIEAVKPADAGRRLPMEFPTVSIHESFSAPPRCIAQPDVDRHREMCGRSDGCRGVIGGCDKTLPAQVMAGLGRQPRSWCRPARCGRHYKARCSGVHRLPPPVAQHRPARWTRPRWKS